MAKRKTPLIKRKTIIIVVTGFATLAFGVSALAYQRNGVSADQNITADKSSTLLISTDLQSYAPNQQILISLTNSADQAIKVPSNVTFKIKPKTGEETEHEIKFSEQSVTLQKGQTKTWSWDQKVNGKLLAAGNYYLYYKNDAKVLPAFFIIETN